MQSNIIDNISLIRHSIAHVLAMAIKKLDSHAQLAIGPVIENGFYYDIKSKRTFTNDDFPEIEKIMQDIIEADLPFTKEEISYSEAISLFSGINESFKVELIKDLGKENLLSIYKTGDDFIDLCRGPHVSSTSQIPIAFKLTSVAGAYWRGDNSRDMLQRIYGTAWLTKSDMDNYFKMIKEAEARDHRKIGPSLGIFHIDEEAVGSVFWLKNGTILFNVIKEYLGKILKKYSYFQVQTPQILSRTLWETSGHWDKFRENMFVVEDDDKVMAIKPMNCPGHIIVYKNGAVKSYRDLPVRIAEFGLCHRNEPSGSLHGLMRIRAFTQDDGHIFCSREQIISETQNICTALREVYSHFGFENIVIKFSDRPDRRAGSDELWDIAEKSLIEAADASGLKYSINKGEGAFYGPKLEFVLKDSLGRDWQCGTLQVDFVLPERFDLHYIDHNGNKQRPVMIHRALIGSLERFIGILIEHYAGKFPLWLAPVQIAITSITDEVSVYASKIYNFLEENGYRCILDIENEKITYKIRKHSVSKVPILIILGKEELNAGTISIRKIDSKNTETIHFSKMLEYFSKAILCK